jgi:predicted DNA-binding transcriptional regulator AlpA
MALWIAGVSAGRTVPSASRRETLGHAKADPRDRTYPPRSMRREAAAAYIGVSTTKFDEAVADGRMPKPKRIDGCVIWDRYRLDQAFDDLPEGNQKTGWENVR